MNLVDYLKAYGVKTNFTFTSYHLDRESELNEFNPGVGTEVGTGPLKLQMGFYKNSHEKVTTFVGTSYCHSITNYLHVGVILGAATGYDHFELGIPFTGAIVPFVSVGRKNRVQIGFVPSEGGGVFSGRIEINFDC
jgi:hypothetical protein